MTSSHQTVDTGDDGLNNATNTAGVDQTIVYTYSNDDQLLTETAMGTDAYTTTDGHMNGSTFVKGYDANGSFVEEVRTGYQAKHRTYKWDLRNRMTGVDSNGNGVFTDTGDVAYTYDNDGVRAKEQTLGTGGTTTHFLIDSMNATGYAKAIEEKSDLGSTVPLRTYVLGAGVEEQVDLNASTGAQTNHYFVRDGHGSTRALTNASGSTTDSYSYTAFGDAIGFTAATAATSWLFGGDGFFDGATGWTYHIARWRDGFHFTSYDSFEVDPASPADLHKYIYSQGNSVYRVDPSGHSSTAFLAVLLVIVVVATMLPIGGAVYYDWMAMVRSPGVRVRQGNAGPDVTSNLRAIRHSVFDYRLHLAGNAAGLHTFDQGPWINPGANWDIDDLKNQRVGSRAVPAISSKTDEVNTVTVAGAAYFQEEVNYWLWGSWARAAGISEETMLAAISHYRIWNYGGSNAAHVGGRQAWARAGYYNDFQYARSAAVTGLVPDVPGSVSEYTSPMPGGQQGKLNFHIGSPNILVEGWK